MTESHEPRRALVTGGGSGIGAACARALARQGLTVTVADRNEGTAAAIADEIGGRRGRSTCSTPPRWRSCRWTATCW